MTTQLSVNNFLKSKSIAVVGVSRNKKKFGYSVFKHLKERNYAVVPVNPNITDVDGVKCYPNLKAIEGKIDGVVLVIPPEQSEKVIIEANDKGIKSVWFQQGSSSDEALTYCQGKGMSVISNECIMMFTEPVESIHKFHRWIWKIFGKLPT